MFIQVVALFHNERNCGTYLFYSQHKLRWLARSIRG